MAKRVNALDQVYIFSEQCRKMHRDTKRWERECYLPEHLCEPNMDETGAYVDRMLAYWHHYDLLPKQDAMVTVHAFETDEVLFTPQWKRKKLPGKIKEHALYFFCHDIFKPSPP